MTDQTPEPDEQSADAGIFGTVTQAALKQQIDTILDLDTILSSATVITRTVPMCMRPDLVARYDKVIEELASLVDGDGNPVNADGAEIALDESSRANELQDEARELMAEMRKFTVEWKFESMPPDEWEEFDASHRTGSDKHLKNERKYVSEIIEKCAVSPKIGPGDVDAKLRKHKAFNEARITMLFNAAFYVNKADGLDVPKLPSYLHAPKLQEPSLS